ncbi:COP9 signalosome complex subunit 3 [Aspergillus hancockii]|nr:COP9 signalosome complex subunit 3 [Aspergillus hancockii]
MSDILSQLTSVSPRLHTSITSDEDYDKQLRDLIAYLQQPNRVSDIVAVSDFLLDLTIVVARLQNLDPASHSLSYLSVFVLKVKSAQGGNKYHLPEEIYPGGELWLKAVRFLRGFDPFQIQYAGHEWRQLVELVIQAAQSVSKPALAVSVIRDTILRLDPSSEVLTSIHSTFIKLSLMTRSYKLALPVLDRQICHFPTTTGQAYQEYYQPLLSRKHESSMVFITDASGFSTKLTYRDHLQFFLCGAMIYMALKRWDKALHFLSIVISCPVTNAVSKIMVEGYKKWVLVSLLGYGKMISHPGVISGHVMRTYQSLAKPYISLANAFEKSDIQRIRAEVEIAQSIFRIDNNTGLVYQVIVTEVESSVASLVMSGVLKAVLLHSQDHDNSTMLRFSSTAKSRIHQEHSVQERIMQEGHSLYVVARSIHQTNHELELGNEYFLFLQRSLKWSDNTGKGSVNAPDEAGNGFDVDEDIMGDIH